MKKLLFPFLFIGIPIIAFSQIKVELSKLTASSSSLIDAIAYTEHYYLGKVNKNGLTFIKKNKVTIQKYDQNLKLVKKLKLKLTYKGEKGLFLDLLKFEDGLYCLFAIKKEKKDYCLLLSPIDENTLEISSAVKELVNLRGRGLLNKAKFVVKHSDNKEYTLFVIQHDGNKNDPKHFQFILLNKNFEELVNEEQIVKDSNKRFYFSNAQVDNEGNIFMVGFQNYSKKIKKEKSWAYLWRYLLDEKKGVETKFNSDGDQYLTDLNFGLEGDELVFAGTYYNLAKMEKDRLAGVVYKRVPKEFVEIGALNYIPFPKDELKDFLNLTITDFFLDQNSSTQNYKLRLGQLGTIGDGKSILFIEQYVKKGKPFIDNNGEYVYGNTYHITSNLIISCINQEGKLEWTVPVNKGVVIDPWFNRHSFAAFCEKDLVRVIFNDNRREVFNIPLDQTVRKNGTYLLEIDSDGQTEEIQLISAHKDGILVAPKFIRAVNEQQFFIYGRSRFKDRIGIISFE